jgi:hypothetical protein
MRMPRAEAFTFYPPSWSIAALATGSIVLQEPERSCRDQSQRDEWDDHNQKVKLSVGEQAKQPNRTNAGQTKGDVGKDEAAGG